MNINDMADIESRKKKLEWRMWNEAHATLNMCTDTHTNFDIAGTIYGKMIIPCSSFDVLKYT